MGLFETLGSLVSKVVTGVVAAITTAIAAPSVATVATAVLTVGAVAGGAVLAKKGFDIVKNKIDDRNSTGGGFHYASSSANDSGRRYSFDNAPHVSDKQMREDFDPDACENLLDDDCDCDIFRKPMRGRSRFDNITVNEKKFNKIIDKCEKRYAENERDFDDMRDDDSFEIDRFRRNEVTVYGEPKSFFEDRRDYDFIDYNPKTKKFKKHKNKKHKHVKFDREDINIIDVAPLEYEGIDYPKQRYSLGRNGIGFRGIDTLGVF